jgi:hypothetical protein
VAHASLLEAVNAGLGYLPVRREGGQVALLFGQPVPGGPLDDAAFLTALDENQVPRSVTILIEVKNIRHWIYPSSSELYQLLDKAAQLQASRPTQLLMPLLICRRVHYLTFLMAQHLGFRFAYTRTQAILPHSSLDARKLREVCDELDYKIVATTEPHPFLVDAYKTTIPPAAVGSAQKWAKVAPIVARLAPILRKDDLTIAERRRLVGELAVEARNVLGPLVNKLGEEVTWRNTEDVAAMNIDDIF